MHDRTNNLLRDLRPGDAARADEVFPADFRSSLLAKIVAKNHAVAIGRRESPFRRRRPTALGVVGATTVLACAAVAVVLATGSAVNPTPADAVIFHTDPSGDIVAAVTDPFATRTRLNAAFAKQGLHITIRLIPVSPSAVGTVVYMSFSNSHRPQIRSLTVGDHCVSHDDPGCAIGLLIPKGFTATATVGLGRPAKPSETYAIGASAFAPGEPLHCSGLLGGSVARALPVLERDKLSVRWMEDVEVRTRHSGVSSRARTVSQPPTLNYIWSANLSAHGHITIQTEPRPWPNTPGAGSHLNDGC